MEYSEQNLPSYPVVCLLLEHLCPLLFYCPSLCCSNKMYNNKYHIVGKLPKVPWKISRNGENLELSIFYLLFEINSPKHIYMTAHFLGLVQTLQ